MSKKNILKKFISSLNLLLLVVLLGACSGQNFQTIASEKSTEATAIYNNKVDVLWVVDNSFTTMENHQNRIANYMDVFHTDLLKTDTDFRIAATTMDMSSDGEQGALVEDGLIVSPSTKNPVEALKKLIVRGGLGSSWENGLSAMKKSMELRPKGFFRDEALLVIVFITDDEDTSNGLPSDYITFLNEFKGENKENEQKWIANYIGVTSLNDPRCTTYGNYSSIGHRYIELAEASGGIVDTICYTDFSTYMNQITVRLKSVLNEFTLKERPILDSITVNINGVNIRKDNMNGWIYNEKENSILLVGKSRPKPDDKIFISYELSNN